MSFALAKIQPPVPRRGQLLVRPAIEARLREALRTHRAVLVSAPAGYGKTALLVRALAPATPSTPTQAVAWVSLDPGDDLHRLLECLLAALEPFDPPWRVAPEGLLTTALRGDTRNRQQAVDDLVNALDACDVEHGAIVLDDLHHLEDEAAQHFLARLIERLGSRWTLVLASREEPSALLARVAAAGELAQFRQADLQFTVDEVQAWFGTLGLDAETARSVHARTAGWAAGLRLAASGARGAGPGSAIDRAAFDFLATEVLAHLDADLRSFLLDTSVLHELDAPRCAALTGDARAARWLDEVERRGLFASLVDESTGTLRLHDLFRDALQHRLRVERPEDWQSLLQRAARIETDPVRRQSLLLAASCFDEAARALLEVGKEMNVRGGATTTLRLIEAFPASYAAGSAELQRITALAKMTVWRQSDAERHFVQAERLYRERGDHAAAQAMASRRAAILVTLGRLSEAAQLVETLTATPLIELEARLLVAVATGWLHVERGENYSAAQAFGKLVDQLDTHMSIDNWGMVPGPRQTACRGMNPLLLRWGTSALVVAGDEPGILRSFAQLALGWQALWQGRPADAVERLQLAIDDARWSGNNIIVRSHAMALSALLALVRGDTSAALATMRARVDEHPVSYGDWGLWHTLYLAARVAASCGDVASLRDWLQRLMSLQAGLPETSPERLRPVAGLQGALAALEGRDADALAHWQEVLLHEERADLFGQVGEVRVRLAAARVRAGALDEAAALLRPLLERADDGPRGVVFAATELAALARQDWSVRLEPAQQATLRAWAASLTPQLAALPASPDASAEARATGTTGASTLISLDATVSTGTVGGEKLTARELEVLALIARGQSNKLIARKLDLSLHTVKRHVANSLAKLGLASRGQAAAWFHAQPPASA